jgi:acetylglutamate kinase
MNPETVMVLKVGGGEVDNPEYLKSLAKYISAVDRRVVIVHGGGKDITRLLEKLGGEAKFHHGLRITDDAAIEVVEMVLSGLVNKRIVGAFVSMGVKALGLSGRDLALVRAKKLEAEVDLGHVGEPDHINSQFLRQIIDMGIVPVISPVSQDSRGVVFNINSDYVAAAVAVTLRAAELVFLSDVPSIYDRELQISVLKISSIETLIASGVIGGGMIPKVRSAVNALKNGVKNVLITDLEGLARYLRGEQAATLITR